MGYKIYFNSYNELMSFLNYTDEILLWETTLFRLTSATNSMMNMDTHSYSSAYSRDFVVFSTLRDYIQQYYTNNGSLPITVDVKLKCPDDYKKSIDPNNYYEAFYVNFYSDQYKTYANITYSENGSELIPDPMVAWTVYLKNMYAKWYTYYTA